MAERKKRRGRCRVRDDAVEAKGLDEQRHRVHGDAGEHGHQAGEALRRGLFVKRRRSIQVRAGLRTVVKGIMKMPTKIMAGMAPISKLAGDDAVLGAGGTSR